jgi:RNA polymerase sigma-70 factor (ECF subfamily)
MDQSLVTRAQRGDADAFELIVRERLESCYAICLSILHSPDDARDATQDAFVSAWRRLPRLRDPDRFDGWLRTIAMNASRDMLRRRRRLREVPIDDGMFGAAEPPGDGRVDLESAVDHLSPGRRQVAERYYLDDEPIRGISASLGVPVGTVKSRLFHARTVLRELLDKG